MWGETPPPPCVHVVPPGKWCHLLLPNNAAPSPDIDLR
jgi:hypothetical protein